MSFRVALMIGIGTAAASGQLAAQVEYGLKAGASFGNISNKGLLPGNLKTRTGAAGGLYLGLRSSVVGLGAEVMYAQRGLRSDEAIAVAETKLDYIDVPVYLKVTIPTPAIRPFAYAGPQASFEVGCHQSNGGSCASTSDRKKTVFAGIIGAGLRLGSSSTGVSVEGRYVYGLTDLKLSTITSSDSYKDRTFLLLVSIGK